jgi:hypothetical protein
MSVECINCKANPATDSKVALFRINPKGITGEWICKDCLTLMERLDWVPHYVHSSTCPNYCDYACNGEAGFDLAEKVKLYLE